MTIRSVLWNKALKDFSCNKTAITELNLSKLPALEKISIDMLLITELDVSHNPELRKIYCKGTNIKKLDVTNTKVDYIECERDCEVIGFKYN